MNLTGLIKKLELPPGYEVPKELAHGEVVARAITRADLEDDVRGINESIDLIQRTRGGGWPTGPVTEAFNNVELVWQELEFREGISFTFVLRDATRRYLGCCYLYPMGSRTGLSEELLVHDGGGPGAGEPLRRHRPPDRAGGGGRPDRVSLLRREWPRDGHFLTRV